MENLNIKTLRDLVIGDGSLYRTHKGHSSGTICSISHSKNQYLWISWKKNKFKELNLPYKFYEDRDARKAWRLCSYSTHQLTEYWLRWYVGGDKLYKPMLEECDFDEESLAILFLDNGSRALKKRYKDYRNQVYCEIDPYVEKFKLSVGKRSQDYLIDFLYKRFGIESTKSREFTGDGEILIGKNHSKQIIKNIVQDFCVKNRLDLVFSYKYNFPLSMRQVQRLSGMVPFDRVKTKG